MTTKHLREREGKWWRGDTAFGLAAGTPWLTSIHFCASRNADCAADSFTGWCWWDCPMSATGLAIGEEAVSCRYVWKQLGAALFHRNWSSNASASLFSPDCRRCCSSSSTGKTDEPVAAPVKSMWANNQLPSQRESSNTGIPVGDLRIKALVDDQEIQIYQK